jgi:dienelactone hydrolase
MILGVVLACVPWGLRNYARFDAVFFIRSNLGLELRMGNHEGVAAAMDVMDAREEHRHPRTHEREALLLREVGEVAYMRGAAREALGWIRSHPGGFLQLTASRVVHWWCGPLHDPMYALLVTALTLLALVGAWRTLPGLAIPQRAALLIPLATYGLRQMDIVISILQVIGVVIGVFILYLLVVALLPGISVPRQPLETSMPAMRRDAIPAPSRRDVSFEVKGTSLRAWLYLPEDTSAPVPCVVMGNGFGGTKDMLLESYALRFQRAGLAALAFDYRHFGDSEGEPRQLVWIPYQLQDYAAAIAYARDLEEVDPARIALWGTSASGGHVVVAAARDQDVACVVAQCPGLDGRAAAMEGYKKVGVKNGLRLIMHGQRDLVRSWLGLSPHKIPIVGKAGSIACLPVQDAYEGYGRLAPEEFVNEVCARIVIRGDKYRPVTKAKKVRCPVLLLICENDELAPLSAAEETAKKLGDLAEVKRYPIGHFDIYIGENFTRSVSDQLDFLLKNL